MKDLIAARRQAIRDAAPCEGCGATLAACKAERGKDPTAPPWFGCCAQGIDMRPCRHVVDAAALQELLDEIEAGHVRTVEEAAPKPAKPRGMGWLDYLDQGEKWKPDGRPMVAITDMDVEWRYNASRWLERRAAVIAARYTLAESLRLAVWLASPLGPSEMTADMMQSDAEREADERARDPLTWIRTTALYRALVADLPDCSVALEAIAERAKHWSTCPARNGADGCTCEAARAQQDGNK